MKSLLKILSLICLLIIYPFLLTGKGNTFYPSTTIQDTLNLNNKLSVDSFPLPIIPPSAGVQFFRDKILFLSLTKNEKKMSPEHISFGASEAYYAALLDSVTGKHYLFSPLKSFAFPCEAVTFNPGFDTIYFTKLAKNGIEKIYLAKFTSGDSPAAGISGDIILLDFCTENYIYSHPTLSADGKMMIFASDRAGTLGKMDLFITKRIHNGWSVPVSLGKEINSSGNEFYPFLDADNNLYFSSDGLKGNGGYDIFRSRFNGKGWLNPVNLEGTINSKNDEIAFTLNPADKKTAFFTRRSGKNEFQLFKVTGKQKSDNLTAIFNSSAGPQILAATVADEEISKPPESKTVISTENKAEKPVEKSLTVSEKVIEKKPSTANNVSRNIPAKPKPAATKTEIGVDSIKLTHPLSANQVDVVFYRVQILSADRPKKEKEIMLNGKSYSLFEYYYKGAYRYCIGDYTSAQPAIELRKTARESTYPQAFLVVFRNNKRSLSANSFK